MSDGKLRMDKWSTQLMFSTVQIRGERNGQGYGGTGFFVKFPLRGKSYVAIVTCAHVVKELRRARVEVHLAEGEGDARTPTARCVGFELPPQELLMFHPTQDLCAIAAGWMFNEAKKQGTQLYQVAVDPSHFATSDDLLDCGFSEPVLMVGYPLGLCDVSSMTPLARRGFTATHPAFNFNRAARGLLDIATFGGSSGSPVFLWDDRTAVPFGGPEHRARFKLLGVAASLRAQPSMTSKGGVAGDTIVPAHLGEYIKASELLAFQSIVDEHVRADAAAAAGRLREEGA